MAEPGPDLPQGVQNILTLFGGMGVFVAGLWGYLRRGAPAAHKENDAVVLSATVADGKAVQELVRTLRDVQDSVHRDSRRVAEAVEDACRAVTENSEQLKRNVPPDWEDILRRADRAAE